MGYIQGIWVAVQVPFVMEYNVSKGKWHLCGKYLKFLIYNFRSNYSTMHIFHLNFFLLHPSSQASPHCAK